jgi:single-stranded-DNA-specific exonuclease
MPILDVECPATAATWTGRLMEDRSAGRPIFTDRSIDPEVERAALAAGYSALQARVLSSRVTLPAEGQFSRVVRPLAADLDGPDSLPDIDIAAALVADAVEKRRPIAIVTDHDADGATSHAIIRLSLIKLGVPPSLLTGFLSHRMIEGYGISDALVDRMLPILPPGTCIITADQGSTDEARIFRLREAGHFIIVTDHHGIPIEGPPKSAHAVVNPVRVDSQFPDPAIAGCHTALLLMAAVREELIRRNPDLSEVARVSEFLDFCAVGTVADAASLGGSRNNRLIVQRGLAIMNSRPRPCWNAMRRLLGKEGDWQSADIAFQIATRINARGRLSDAMLGVEFLCCDDEEAAYQIVLELDSNNKQRRSIERALTTRASALANLAVAEGRLGLCLWLGEDSHAGVHGITASRMVEKFGRPTICLSPVQGEPGLATGSIRTTEQVHVLDALESIKSSHPELLISGGGHRGAGGLKIKRSDIEALTEAWDQRVRVCYQDSRPGPKLMLDGVLEEPLPVHVRELAELEPYGRGFESPVFSGTWLVTEVRLIGDGSHLKLRLTRGRQQAEAVWFGAVPESGAVPLIAGQSARLAYSIDEQTYRGVTRLQLMVRGME